MNAPHPPHDPRDHGVPNGARLLGFRKAKARKRRDILRARRDPAFFVEYAIPHEKTGKAIVNAPFHVAWHDFFSRVEYGVISASVEHGKSMQIAVGRLLWEIGNNPELRCIIIGSSDEAAEKSLWAIKGHIDRNPRVREVFPNLRRSPYPDHPWSKRNIVVARSSYARDPTIQARGVGSKNILGSRLDLAILDDLLHEENTHTKPARDKLHAWLDDYVITRIEDDMEGERDELGRIFFIGNPWNGDDLIHRLPRLPGWEAMTTPAVVNPDDPPEHWVPSWPEKWPLRRLMKRRSKMLPHSFARKYLCRVLSDDIRRFRKAWIDHMFEQGRGRVMLDRQPTLRGSPMRCFTGVDFGIGRKKGHAKTVFFTIAVEPRPPHRRVVVHIEAGRWTGPDILRKAASIARRFDSELCTESNQAQEWMGQFAAEFEGLPVIQLHTGQNKWSEEYGVESIAVELKGGLWIAPTGANGFELSTATLTAWPTTYDELAEWSQEMYDYDPADHTGDRLMAAWKAREGARLWLQPRSQPSNHMMR